jgi:thioesterase domain-containing protein/NAD(P)-dependent dehydrogenase (short-subunit alcohol dehydrogenase family)/acyl carrier protein
MDWEVKAGEMRRAAVSSFGFSGTNAHVVLEEFAPAQARPASLHAGPLLIVLSAKNTERLKAYAKSLLTYVQKAHEPPLNLDDLAYTHQVGREAMPERLGMIVTSLGELQDKLGRYGAGENGIEALCRGRVDTSQEMLSALYDDEDMAQTMQSWIAKGKLRKLLELWVKGLSLDWNLLYKDNKPRRISAPTYPFAKERYWASETVSIPALSAYPVPGLTEARLHPLLHENTSTLREQCYSSRFTGEEFFFKDHVVQQYRILPGVGHLEMARAAVHKALGQGDALALRLEHIVWMRPLMAGGIANTDPEVRISLYPQEDNSVVWKIHNNKAGNNSAEDTGLALYSRGQAQILSEKAYAADSNRHSLKRLSELRSHLSEPGPSVQDFYKTLDAQGLHLGQAFRGITAIYKENNDGSDLDEVLACLNLPEKISKDADAFYLHPSIMDSALQASVAMRFRELSANHPAPQLGLPFALEQLDVIRPCSGTMWAWARRRTSASNNVMKFDVELYDEAGNACVSFRGLSIRAVTGDLDMQADSHASIAAQAQWQDQQLEVQDMAAGQDGKEPLRRLVVLCTSTSMDVQLRSGLEEDCQLIEASPLVTDESNLACCYEAAAIKLFEALQLHLRTNNENGSAGPTPLLVQIVVAAEGQGQLYTGLHALMQSAHQEYPCIRGQLIEVDAGTGADAETLRKLLASEASQRQQAHVRYRHGTRQIAYWQEWVAAKDQDNANELPSWRPDGVYLITGGAGGLGLLLARDILASTLTAHVVLCGRSTYEALPPARQQQLLALQDRFSPARASYQAADFCERRSVQELIERILTDHGQITGIVHSAGVIADAYLLQKSSEQFRSVLAPKVQGVTWLDEATKDLPLDFILLFSSVAGSLGNIGQADYAAGNGYLDAFARWRNEQVAISQRHGFTLSLGWPLWAEGSMGIHDATYTLLRTTIGIEVMPSAVGMEMLHQALVHRPMAGHLLILYGQNAKLRQLLGLAAVPTAYQKNAGLAIPQESATVNGDKSALELRLQHELSDMVINQLKLPASVLQPDKEFREYGFDSISLTEFVNQLNARYGLQLMPTIFFEHSTLASLSAYLTVEHGSQLASRFNLGGHRDTTIDHSANAMPDHTGASSISMSSSSSTGRFLTSYNNALPVEHGKPSSGAVTDRIQHTNEARDHEVSIQAQSYDNGERNHKRGRPLFCIPGIGGSALSLDKLRHYLGSDEHSLYALQPRGLDGISAPYASIEEAAADYVRIIRQVQPQGPYLLAGHSFGGWEAFEIACQLQAQGQEIETVMIFDLYAPSVSNQAMISGKIDGLELLLQALQGKAKEPLGLTSTALSLLDEEGQLQQLHAALVRGRQLPGKSTPELIRGLMNVFRKNIKTMSLHRAEPQGTVPVVLYRASELLSISGQEERSELPRDLGWSALAKTDVSVITVPGNHFTMLDDPHVEALAAAVLEQLNIVEAKALQRNGIDLAKVDNGDASPPTQAVAGRKASKRSSSKSSPKRSSKSSAKQKELA